MPLHDTVARRTSGRVTAADLSAGVLVLWTWFVWGGRIGNVAGDPELSGAALIGTLALASSFVVAAAALGVAVLLDRGRATPGVARVVLTWTLALWTTGVWGVRVVDIAVFGDHAVGFVLVHVALAAGSVALAVWAVTSLRRRRSHGLVAAG